MQRMTDENKQALESVENLLVSHKTYLSKLNALYSIRYNGKYNDQNVVFL